MPIIFETNHGSYRLPADDQPETVRSVLTRYGVPLSSVWTYVVEPHTEDTDRGNSRQAHFIPSTTPIDAPWLEGRNIHARVTRNVNLPGLLQLQGLDARHVENASTEWTFPDDAAGAFLPIHSELTPQECLEFVRKGVDEVLSQWPTPNSGGLVVGTSGGGDSNVLLSALAESEYMEGVELLPTMMLGIPDWDTQHDNAVELSESLGLPLVVIDKQHAAKLAGVRSLDQLIEDFLTNYPGAELEIIGTWLLRRVLSGLAQERGISFVATGANREDVLAEGLARIARGHPPLPIPYRQIGDVTFVFPMYGTPKKIGDGAYPAFSLENYEARNPSHSPGRSVFYHLAYLLADLAPGIDVDFLRGFGRLADIAPSPIARVESLQDYAVTDAYTDEQLQKWRELLERNRVTS